MVNVAASIDYTSRDFNGLRQSLIDYAALNFPDWTPASEGDFGILLLELLAYIGDIQSYYVDRAQQEAYITTATQRSSILQIAKLLGYTVGTGSPATGSVTLQTGTSVGPGTAPAVVVPAGTQWATNYMSTIDGQVIFETNTTVTVPAATAGVPGTITVAVTEGQTIVDPSTGDPISIGTSDGTPDQVFRLPNPLVYSGFTHVYVGDVSVEWSVVDELIKFGPTDEVATTFMDDSNFTWIQFGDGITGAIPGAGLSIFAKYRTGAGSLGNVGAGAVTTLVDANNLNGVSLQLNSTDSTKSTSTAMAGGSDPDTTEQIRENAPKTFFTQNRAVTLDDYTNLALAVDGVSKANAVSSFFSSVVVYIIGPDGNPPTTGLKTTVGNSLQGKAMAGVTVTVASPSPVQIDLGLAGGNNWPSIFVVETYNATLVLASVNAALANFFAFTNVQLGQLVTLADIYQTIMSVPGVQYCNIPALFRNDSVHSGFADIQLQLWEYPTIDTTTFTITASGGM